MINPRITINNLAKTNPIVKYGLEAWRQGQCSYEKALALIIVELDKQNQFLMNNLLEKKDGEVNIPIAP